MPQVRLLVSRTDGARGDVVEVSADEAQRMIAAEQGELVRSKVVEKAVAKPRAEKAKRG